MKYTMFLLVSGLLVLAILPLPVFAGGPQANRYNIIIEIDGEDVTTFEATGQENSSAIRIEGVPDVSMTFPEDVLDDLAVAEDVNPQPEYPLDRPVYWSPLEDDLRGAGFILPNRFYVDNPDEAYLQLQELNTIQGFPFPYPDPIPESEAWWLQGANLDKKKKKFSCEFRRRYYYYTNLDKGQGCCDQYHFFFEMQYDEGNSPPYSSVGGVTLRFGHYTMTLSKAPGKKQLVPSQHLRGSSSPHDVVVTITKLSKPAAPPAEPSTWGQIKSLLK